MGRGKQEGRKGWPEQRLRGAMMEVCLVGSLL